MSLLLKTCILTMALLAFYMGKMAASGSLGRFIRCREAVPNDIQNVVRRNRDALYLSAVFDLDADPVRITLPETVDVDGSDQ
ncbi:DUF1254 domain-containing protein [Pseudomonas sp. RIT288]|jgi:hypothetical protein|uniref:DUF1254 domain-containing protein n=1 Tax=Pseudomonas sp. RIT288 TaxID=1470589 RepID=UPI000447DB41|nr:DUF1254 domain-containing protein [Pseudomonas sp. RIT288]EZP31282.1 hypothetical protein BW33_02516 [Pseudomonas sp. RIT288]